MKLPISWLAEYIDISDLSVEELADRITFAGIEIEGIETVGPCFDDIVVGLVKTCAPHPDSDHLNVCTVFDGTQDFQVVCGAPNCRAGMLSAFARIGAKIPENGMVLKKGKLRGVESFGMLCSARELNLSADHSGIMELDASLKPGTPLQDLYGSSETVFEVEVTWNRGDCLSILGIAREFAAILGRPLKMPEIDFPELSDVTAADKASVEIRNPVGCPVYTARVLPHVERLPSPEFMRKRLELCGMRSIDVVVDVSNYVMLECGQPLHTFDYRQVHDGKIIVRNANPGETIRTLDGKDRALDPSMLLITDPVTPLAIAGVMGGEGSEIEPDTTSVLLEAAAFDAPSIKATETTLALHTESAHRYERGVDPFLPDWASRRACHLLVQYANATVASGVVQDDHRDHTPREITLRFERAREVIGLNISNDRQIEILNSLCFETVSRDDAAAVLRVPTYRLDCTAECDLIEEIARMEGLDALPDNVPTSMVVKDANDAPVRAASFCRHALVGLGFSEILNYSFTAPAVLDAWSTVAADARVVLPNPVSADQSVLRDNLAPQVIEVLARNQSRGVDTACVFEMGRVFFRDAKSGLPSEEDRVCLALMGFAGRVGTDRMRKVEPEESLLWLKGALEALAERLHTPAMRLQSADYDAFEKGCAAEIIIAGRSAGRIGLVKSSLTRKHRIPSPVVVAELRRAPLIQNVFRVPKAKNVPTLPGTERDIALIAPEGVTHEEIVKTIRKAGPKELADIRLFDIFRGKAIGEGKVSLAYRLLYRSETHTLKDEDVNRDHEAVKATLRNKLKVEIRDS